MPNKLHQFKNTINKKLVQSAFTVILFLKFRYLYANVDDFIKKLRRKKPTLYLLEYHITKHCNMNCKSCFHFSSLVKTVEYGDFNQYVRDLTRLTFLFSNIKNIHLMSGEPLLNPELPQFIHITRKILPNAKIHILTNGMQLLKMDGTLLEAIKSCEVHVRLSTYEPMVKKRAEIANFLTKQQIKHWMSDPYLHFAKYINPRGDSNPKKVVAQCPASRCTFLSNGKMTRCALPFNIKYFNQHFKTKIDMSNDQIDIHDEQLDGFKLKKRLLKPMAACCFCNKVEWIPWSQSKKRNRSDVTLNDFCSNT